MSNLIPSQNQPTAGQVDQNSFSQNMNQPHNLSASPYGHPSKTPIKSYGGPAVIPSLPNSAADISQYGDSRTYSPVPVYAPQKSPNTSFGNNSYENNPKDSAFNPHLGSSSSNTVFNPHSMPPTAKHLMVQNGPYTGGTSQNSMNSLQDPNLSINGVSTSNIQAGMSPSWPTFQRFPPQPDHSPMQVKQSQSSGVSVHSDVAGTVAQHSPWQPVDTKTVPATNLVPSAGLPLPYNSQVAVTTSPQITPGPSQPPSARSSRNPSPISTQRYDFMEGQFSNKPSPSSSTTNLQNTSLNSPFSSNIAQYPLSSSANTTSNSNMTPGCLPSNFPMSAPPFPNLSSSSSQPAPSPITPLSSTRPRYPQQVGYNQSTENPSLIMSQPRSLYPPSPMYNTSPQPQSSPYPAQSGVPEGPVGGVSGYDPQLHAKMAGMSVHSSFSRLWGNECVNLLQDKNILPAVPLEPPKPVLSVDRPNCSPDIFRCTLTKIPDTSSLLQKSRLPFGILIHPFRDVSNLPIIQCNTIVRCRNCRTYINPFVTFVDMRRWKCNLCFRVNDLPEEFLYDPVTRAYGDPSRRPEIKNATIEFIAPSDYMLRPPQPAAYLFLLDVSHGACEIGYLENFCQNLLENLDDLPGDTRTKIGFITFDGSIHFYNLAEGLNQPHMLIVSDIEDVFLPSPDNLLVNLHESKALIRDLLDDIPKKFSSNWDTNSCLGAALEVAYKLMSPVGGRVTVIQTCLANYGPGLLKNREDPNQRAAKDVTNVGPASDFYKKLALECSGQQVAVDLFLLCSQYVDIATISCISKYSSGSVHYYPGYHHQLCKQQVVKFSSDLKRYLTRKIGFEAVMRIRCTRGLSIHTFHGNFFVRSTDLLSLPNVNPDIGFGMQIAIEESLTDCNSVCFQAAVLYTSSNGERRIRVHTLSLPVVSILQDIWGGADQEAVIGLVSKMAVDRSITSSLSDARDALINVCIDLLGAYKLTLQSGQTGSLMAPYSARLIPLFVLALLKHVAFRTGVSTKLDERVYAMECMKTLPLSYLMKYIYPTLYPVHALDDKNGIHQDDDVVIPQPVILQLCSEKVDRHGVYLLDCHDVLYMYIGRAVNDYFCVNVLGVSNFSAIPDNLTSLPELHTLESERLRTFISWLQDQRPSPSPLKIIREDSNARLLFQQYMVDDRTESLFSYYEFLHHLRQQISK